MFRAWIDEATRRFKAAGLPGPKAREFALTCIAALEGAFVVSRTLRSPEPMRATGRVMAAALESAC